MHVFDTRQRYQVLRLCARQRPQARLAQDAVARLIARPRLPLAPGRQHTEHGELLRPQSPGLLDLAIRFVRIGFTLQVGDQLGTVLHHPAPLVLAEAR